MANQVFSELNLTKTKAAVLKHDSKLCQQNVQQLDAALSKGDPLKSLI